MATIGSVVGWDPASPSALPALAHLDHLAPDDYPAYAHRAAHDHLDLRTSYALHLDHTHAHELESDRSFLERAREFVELHDQVDASTQLLTELASFLGTFQRDLAAVSGHISELQGRSKSIEARLDARKAVERSLHPFLASIAISPALVATIVDSDVSDAWIPAVRELDRKLGAIRGGARVDSRKNLDEAAEALRVAASSKILAHLVALLKPYTVSVSPSLPSLHAHLSALKPLFDFLRRHAARQAHEFQKAYAQTARWYYETGFRRYVRALEKIRTSRAAQPVEPIGSVSGVADTLALLNQRRSSAATPQLSTAATSAAVTSALDNAQLAGPGVILAHMAQDRSFHPPPEALFRSASLVLADNAAHEYLFCATFFGQHSTLDLAPAGEPAPPGPPLLRRSATNGSLNSAAANGAAAGVPPASESGRTIGGGAGGTSVFGGAGGGAAGARAGDDRVQRAVVEQLWKSVMEPALEYTRNFVNVLIDPVAPAPISLLSMLRLNDLLSAALVSSAPSPPPPAAPGTPSTTVPGPSTSAGDLPPCPPLEAHLTSLRLLLFPTFSRTMSAQIDSLRRINGASTSSASGVGGMLARATGAAGGGGGAVKDSVVQVIVARYCELFNAVVALSSLGTTAGAGAGARAGEAAGGGVGGGEAGAEALEQADEMVFNSLLRLRQELDKLLTFQASKIATPDKQRAFLATHYEELLQGLSAGLSSHARTQAEVAHYREAARKVS
ncbi:Vps52p [Rhodotorula paludigena]|uniref:Vps52p n=1 Tax=Rhodotorula paludigena TaxID=86838 RepID=UPI003176F804